MTSGFGTGEIKLNDNIKINYNEVTYNFTVAYINRMYSDIWYVSTEFNTYYAVDSVPLYMNGNKSCIDKCSDI